MSTPGATTSLSKESWAPSARVTLLAATSTAVAALWATVTPARFTPS